MVTKKMITTTAIEQESQTVMENNNESPNKRQKNSLTVDEGSSSTPKKRQTSYEDLQKLNIILGYDDYGFAIFQNNKMDSERCHEYATISFEEEVKETWKQTFDKWDHDSNTRCGMKLHNLIKSGVPTEFRGELWQKLLEIDALKKSANFNYKAQLVAVREQLVDIGISEYSGRESICHLEEEEYTQKAGHVNIEYLRIIMLDVDRSYPTHKKFMGTSAEAQEGRASLYRLLATYARYNRTVGYCQGMSYIAGMFLMHMGEEEAFWCMVSILERKKYMLGYFDDAMKRIQSHAEVFARLLKQLYPKVDEYFKRYGVDALMFVTPWFMCLFTSLPCWDTVLAIWDIMLLNGVKTMFEVGLAIIGHLEEDILKSTDLATSLPLLLHTPVEKAKYWSLMPTVWCTSLDDWEIPSIQQIILEEKTNENSSRRVSMKRRRIESAATEDNSNKRLKYTPEAKVQPLPSLFKRFVNIFTPKDQREQKSTPVSGYNRTIKRNSVTRSSSRRQVRRRSSRRSITPRNTPTRRSVRRAKDPISNDENVPSCEIAEEKSSLKEERKIETDDNSNFKTPLKGTPTRRKSPRLLEKALKDLNTPSDGKLIKSEAKNKLAFKVFHTPTPLRKTQEVKKVELPLGVSPEVELKPIQKQDILVH